MPFTPRRLLRLYPPAWRERYGDEFLAAIEEEPIGARQILNIAAGAVDAWLSRDVRQALSLSSMTSRGGTPMTFKSMMACQRSAQRISTRDSMLGAGVMIAVSAVLMLAAGMARQQGWLEAGKAVSGLAFPVAFMLSMPFWLMKSVPWRAQAVLVGGTLLLLAGIGALSAL